MPEAAVNKNAKPLFAKDEIGFAEDRLVPAPACDLVFAKNADQCELGILVPAPANAGHYVGTLRLGENVRHFRAQWKTSEASYGAGFLVGAVYSVEMSRLLEQFIVDQYSFLGATATLRRLNASLCEANSRRHPRTHRDRVRERGR